MNNSICCAYVLNRVSLLHCRGCVFDLLPCVKILQEQRFWFWCSMVCLGKNIANCPPKSSISPCKMRAVRMLCASCTLALQGSAEHVIAGVLHPPQSGGSLVGFVGISASLPWNGMGAFVSGGHPPKHHRGCENFSKWGQLCALVKI